MSQERYHSWSKALELEGTLRSGLQVCGWHSHVTMNIVCFSIPFQGALNSMTNLISLR